MIVDSVELLEQTTTQETILTMSISKVVIDSQPMELAEFHRLCDLRCYLAYITGSIFIPKRSPKPDWLAEDCQIGGLDQIRKVWPHFLYLTKGRWIFVVAHDWENDRDLCYLGRGYAAAWNYKTISHTIFFRPKDQPLFTWLEKILPDRIKAV